MKVLAPPDSARAADVPCCAPREQRDPVERRPVVEDRDETQEMPERLGVQSPGRWTDGENRLGFGCKGEGVGTFMTVHAVNTVPVVQQQDGAAAAIHQDP